VTFRPRHCKLFRNDRIDLPVRVTAEDIPVARFAVHWETKGAEHRIRIEPEGGFEFKVAEIGRGWTKASGPISYELADSYGQFAELHLCQDGIID